MSSIAYRMLASVSDAENIAKEFLRYHRELAEGSEIRSAKAFLSPVKAGHSTGSASGFSGCSLAAPAGSPKPG